MIVYGGWSGLVSIRMISNHRSKALPHIVAINSQAPFGWGYGNSTVTLFE